MVINDSLVNTWPPAAATISGSRRSDRGITRSHAVVGRGVGIFSWKGVTPEKRACRPGWILDSCQIPPIYSSTKNYTRGGSPATLAFAKS